jgi:hypothetical protein
MRVQISSRAPGLRIRNRSEASKAANQPLTVKGSAAMNLENKKPLGGKSYGHIAHLPGSRMGPGDHKCHEGQKHIATEKPRDRHDLVIVQEKLDGSNVAVARLDGMLFPLSRAGYLAGSSPYEQHWRFAEWVYANQDRFMLVLQNGERLCGEWLMQAHGTRYSLKHEPFVAFDLMTGTAARSTTNWCRGSLPPGSSRRR